MVKERAKAPWGKRLAQAAALAAAAGTGAFAGCSLFAWMAESHVPTTTFFQNVFAALIGAVVGGVVAGVYTLRAAKDGARQAWELEQASARERERQAEARRRRATVVLLRAEITENIDQIALFALGLYAKDQAIQAEGVPDDKAWYALASAVVALPLPRPREDVWIAQIQAIGELFDGDQIHQIHRAYTQALQVAMLVSLLNEVLAESDARRGQLGANPSASSVLALGEALKQYEERLAKHLIDLRATLEEVQHEGVPSVLQDTSTSGRTEG